ncbi:MAG: tripartite tricarboxylate transporter TctB family protein [Smithellaceae bacterium]|nr:tripartite tricarboxylate transporter TctB family protein [Smithellaceae bacterium]
MTIRQRENIIYGGIALGSLILLGWVIPAHSPPYPGYGVSAALVPNVTAGIMLTLAVLSLGRNLWSGRAAGANAGEEKPSGAAYREDRVHLGHLARFMVPSALLMPAMKWVGFIPAGLAFMLLIQYLCGQRKPGPAALTAAVSVFLIYALMRYGLGVPMP